MTAATQLTERFLSDEAALRRRQAEANRVIAASGAAHLIHASGEGSSAPNGPWSLDPIPLVLDGAVFDRLAGAVRERVAALELLLGDLYGPRQLVRDAVVPAEALAASPRYRLADVGVPPPPRWLVTYAADVIADVDGTWRLVQDLTDTPTGIAYALLDRSVMVRVAAELLGPTGGGDLASLSAFPAELRRALAAVTAVPSPRIVLFSDGIDDPAYVEHSALARLLGFHLVESPDLVVRKRRLWLRTLGGLDPIDVVYRRTADAAVDPIELSTTGTAGVPGLLFTTAEGGVVLANAHGSGVLEDPDLAGFWPDAIAALTGSRPTLQLLGGGAPPFAPVPTLRGGRADSAAVVVRLHAVSGPDGVVVMAGGNGRVLAPDDDPRRPTARLAKDVWVLGAERAVAVVTAPHLPQVDLATSVPTRAADSLFWVGRAAERAEALARTARVVAARRQQDPGLASLDAGRWARRMAAVLRGLSGRESDGGLTEGWPIVALDAELAAAGREVGDQLGQLVAGAATVAEYMSAAAGRVLESLADWRDEFADGGAPIDGLDAVLADLAALAGLWSESTVRGPAWRFGDIGRRVERALVVLELVELCLTGGTGDAPLSIDRDDAVDLSALEVLLSANDSLVAYRRRHRSDVELDAAVALLLRDQDNPRSFSASVQHLAEHASAVHWSEGAAAASRLSRLADGSPLDIQRAHAATTAFAGLVVDTWFATPVNPMLVRGRLRGVKTA